MNLTEIILEPIRVAWEIWPPLGVVMTLILGAWFVWLGKLISQSAEETNQTPALGGYHPETGFRFDPNELEDKND